ncbi:STAS domain-containing protein [Planomonospora venezuelensis]|uniref:Anti-sigma factor antagonist n=1 Tax=Planomonospora venezuelensis TaxID=1999 RepID=A0A841DCQ6_PLAVE|nr:STAS domain-containing protein [Planomonospora venezuelensis]MBB5966224.1 anti-anti-sigma factor [Planomonospora venezuelensis]GIM98471.1 anti-sigma factor antagonist [Planomonospora venezuelensis]
MRSIDPGELGIFSASVGLRGDIVIVRLSGELDMSTAPRLGLQIAEAARLISPPRLVIDVQHLDFCDSSGLNLMVKTVHEVERAGGRLLLSGVRDRFARLLRVTGLGRTLQARPTVELAVAELTGPGDGGL